ncbi:putative ribonuclease H-like domain-containing protein, partial [Tanacetum coccineum]
MCDKKNSILFTETECLILSPSFKLLDESQVVLRAPRKDDVYNLDLKNSVPSGGITCLYANAISDKSKLWHRRLGHVNFQNINKLVKGHLVRGLPSKVFVNDHTCVACKKGKQHKASCKAKLERIIRKPLELPLNFPINTLTTKVFSFMVKKGKKISGNVTPLFPSMLAQLTEDEGAVSERPSETQPTPSPTHPSEDQSEPQPDPFLRPSSSNPIPDSIPEGSGGNHGAQAANIKDLKAQIKQLKKKVRPIINHHKASIKSLSLKKRLARKKKMESVSKQGRKTFKSIPTMNNDIAFDDLDDAIDYMETGDAHDKGTVKNSEETRVSTEDQVSTDKPKVSTDKLKVSTDKLNEGTTKPNEGTAEPKDGNSDESAAPT